MELNHAESWLTVIINVDHVPIYTSHGIWYATVIGGTNTNGQQHVNWSGIISKVQATFCVAFVRTHAGIITHP